MKIWLAAAAVAALLHGAAVAQDVVLRFAYENEEVFPYYMGTQDVPQDRPGVTIDMLRLLEARLPNLKVQLVRMPWKRCLVQLQEGNVDAVVDSFKPERMQNGVFPTKAGKPDVKLAIDVRAYYLFKRADTALFWDGVRLSGADGAVGVPRGYSIIDDLARLGVRVEETRSSGTDFRKLQLNRLIAVATLEKVGAYYVKHAPAGTLVKVAPPLASKEYYLIFSHQFFAKHEELSASIWRHLVQIRDRDMDAMFPKYLD